jgi:serine/threonine protein kinase
MSPRRRFRAPESAATAASDVFSAGIILYELFTGEHPFDGEPTRLFGIATAAFLYQPSSLRPELTAAFDDWLQELCAFKAESRPSASVALVGSSCAVAARRASRRRGGFNDRKAR